MVGEQIHSVSKLWPFVNLIEVTILIFVCVVLIGVPNTIQVNLIIYGIAQNLMILMLQHLLQQEKEHLKLLDLKRDIIGSLKELLVLVNGKIISMVNNMIMLQFGGLNKKYFLHQKKKMMFQTQLMKTIILKINMIMKKVMVKLLKKTKMQVPLSSEHPLWQ